jgi:NAD-dependent SIR2 family protein deacetylase
MKILVFTGAGISRESGLATFRNEDGLWAGLSVAEVCSVEAWKTHPQKVLDFYNARRDEVRKAQPNAAHLIIAQPDAPLGEWRRTIHPQARYCRGPRSDRGNQSLRQI